MCPIGLLEFQGQLREQPSSPRRHGTPRTTSGTTIARATPTAQSRVRFLAAQDSSLGTAWGTVLREPHVHIPASRDYRGYRVARHTGPSVGWGAIAPC
jgi:hypothetical protein